MEIILLENIINLGNIGDKVKVRDGYGRNFLLKQGKALRFNKVNLEYEAAVCGGVPIIRSIKEGLIANKKYSYTITKTSQETWVPRRRAPCSGHCRPRRPPGPAAYFVLGRGVRWAPRPRNS